MSTRGQTVFYYGQNTREWRSEQFQTIVRISVIGVGLAVMGSLITYLLVGGWTTGLLAILTVIL
ncbi:MAG TPA: hypothetical protein VI547_06000, partial [Anaerolineales bacterium]|nr:hypothetical protein [Anaerolineales bacterium]